MTGIWRAAPCCIALVLMAIGASSAGAQTVVHNDLNGRGATIEVGETLKVSLSPPNSGSSGFHWRVAKRPRGSVLRLVSNRTTGRRARQVLVYKARGAGFTRLRLQYVAPGRHGRVARTFRFAVAVNTPMPQLDCDGSGRPIRPIAQTGSARVFSVRRTVRVYAFAGVVERLSYDVFLGCAFAEGRTHQLGAYAVSTGSLGSAPDAGENELFDLTMRGTVVGYAFEPGCPFEARETVNCTSEPGPVVAAQDLNGGRVIRGTFVETSGPDDYNRVAGLVVSPAGGIAWMEVGHHEGQPEVFVRRSDGPAPPGAAPVEDAETLDSGADVDRDSLFYDGTNIEWRKAGVAQRAPLR
jgi:hypothetical protein